MKFVAVIEYSSDLSKIAEIRPLHRQYLAGVKERGQLVASGPFADDSGALIIYETNSRAEAERILQSDPFHQNGIFVKYQLRPWTVVLANRELLPGRP